MKRNPFIDLRAQMKTMTMTVEKNHSIAFKNTWLVLLGLRFIEFGCFLCGMDYEEKKSEESNE